MNTTEVNSTLHDDSSPSSNGVGLSNARISQNRRQMLDLVNRLHSTGIQIDIDLPQSAVIGSQSAGKSSLIESISGITLPRASGTCTRCPTECRLSGSRAPWKCIVSLRIMKDGKAHNQQFGDIILDKTKVEDRIKRAQRAILNPSKQAEYYLSEEGDVIDDSELTFSSNCVSLQISGPDVADLSFCDLPGLIAGVGRGGNANDIELVKNLVASYIKKPSCIILLTVACETDFQNQGAHELAKVYDPEGKRTIGVLTKPDRIPSGEEYSWLYLIRNEKEALENNWYCVRQPGSNDLKEGLTWEEARKREESFFALTEPWSDLDLMYQKYLGTSNLVGRLSTILSDLILRRIPQIQAELDKAIFSTREALNKLPKAPSEDPQNEVNNLLHNFVRDLAKHIEGVPDQDGLMQSIQPAQEQFRRAIRTTAPDFRPFERGSAATKVLGKPDFLECEEGSKGKDQDDNEEAVDKQIYIDEVLERAHRARTRELPGHYPFVVQKTFIDGIVKKWRVPAHTLCRAVNAMLSEHVMKLVQTHFNSFGQGGLEQRVRVLLQDHLRKCMEKTEKRIDWLLDLEDRPFTLNTHYLSDYKNKFLTYYRGAREQDKNGTLITAIQGHSSSGESTNIAKVLASLAEVGINGIRPEEIAKLLPSDGMEPALNIMADVRAYFQVAYKRIVDNIPLAIDQELVYGIERSALQTLNLGLGVNSSKGLQVCMELAQESPNVAARREELLKKQERLSSASQQLLQIGL